MIFFLALIPATMLSVAGLVALFVSQRSEGALRTVGRYLGFWAFTLAVLVTLASIIAASHASHVRGFGPRFRNMGAPSVPAPRRPPAGAPASPETSPSNAGPPAPQN